MAKIFDGSAIANQSDLKRLEQPGNRVNINKYLWFQFDFDAWRMKGVEPVDRARVLQEIKGLKKKGRAALPRKKRVKTNVASVKTRISTGVYERAEKLAATRGIPTARMAIEAVFSAYADHYEKYPDGYAPVTNTGLGDK